MSHFHWVRAHVNIRSNEDVDFLAKTSRALSNMTVLRKEWNTMRNYSSQNARKVTKYSRFAYDTICRMKLGH